MSKAEWHLKVSRGPLPRQKAGRMGDRRLKRLKTRGSRNTAALKEWNG